MNSRNTDDNGNGESRNIRNLITTIRQSFNENTNDGNSLLASNNPRVNINQRQNAQSNSNSSQEEPLLTRDVLQLVWSRMQNLPNNTRRALLNSLTSSQQPYSGLDNNQIENELEESQETQRVPSGIRSN
jgi:hypothetical protein